MTIKMIAKAAGYEPTIETDPDSTDFMKVKIDNTRYDPFGGYQQYFVPVFKILMNSSKSIKTDEHRPLDSNRPFSQNAFDVAINAIANKASPPMGLAIAKLKGSEVGGRPLDFTNLNPAENTAARYLTNPIILQDMYEVIKEDPYLLPLIGLDMFGQNVDVYSDQSNQFRELKEMREMR